MSDDAEVSMGFIDPDSLPTPDVFVAPGERMECHGWEFEMNGQGASCVWVCPTCATVWELTTPPLPGVAP